MIGPKSSVKFQSGIRGLGRSDLNTEISDQLKSGPNIGLGLESNRWTKVGTSEGFD